jgi:hypothetical protein
MAQDRRRLHAKSLARILTRRAEAECAGNGFDALGGFVWLLQRIAEQHPEALRDYRPHLLAILEETELVESGAEDIERYQNARHELAAHRVRGGTEH